MSERPKPLVSTEIQGPRPISDPRMLGLLLRKQAWVNSTQDKIGKSLKSAENEVMRQIRQVSRGEPVTKSGPSD